MSSGLWFELGEAFAWKKLGSLEPEDGGCWEGADGADAVLRPLHVAVKCRIIGPITKLAIARPDGVPEYPSTRVSDYPINRVSEYPALLTNERSG